MNKEGILGLLMIVFIFLVLSLFCLSVYFSLNEIPIKCHKYESVKYREVGTGGLLGGIRKVETQGDFYDGYMEKCIEGIDLFGNEVKKK